MRGASGVGIDAGCGEDRSRAGSDERRPTTAEQGSRSAGEFVGGGQSGEEEGKGSEKRTLGIIRERAHYSNALRVTLMGYGHSSASLLSFAPSVGGCHASFLSLPWTAEPLLRARCAPFRAFYMLQTNLFGRDIP